MADGSIHRTLFVVEDDLIPFLSTFNGRCHIRIRARIRMYWGSKAWQEKAEAPWCGQRLWIDSVVVGSSFHVV